MKNWTTKHERPEDTYENASSYYEKNEAARYATSNAMRKTQRELTMRALELQIPALDVKILDAGCGCGYSIDVLKEIGYEKIKGFDITSQFIQIAKAKGHNVKTGDLRCIPFREKFDVIISISALQWITAKNLEANIEKTAKEFKRLLRPKGYVLIQFYPKSEAELMHTAKVFNQNNFTVKVVTDNPENPKKRKNFLILSVKK